jgi:hypothetical protein
VIDSDGPQFVDLIPRAKLSRKIGEGQDRNEVVDPGGLPGMLKRSSVSCDLLADLRDRVAEAPNGSRTSSVSLTKLTTRIITLPLP